MRILILSDTLKQGSQIEYNIMTALHLVNLFDYTWQYKYGINVTIETVVSCERHPTGHACDFCIVCTERNDAKKWIRNAVSNECIIDMNSGILSKSSCNLSDMCSISYELISKISGVNFERSEFNNAFKQQISELDDVCVSAFNKYNIGNMHI